MTLGENRLPTMDSEEEKIYAILNNNSFMDSKMKIRNYLLPVIDKYEGR